MGSMKLCVIAPDFLPVWGGVGTYLVELVRHLPKDIEVHVVTPMREGIGQSKVCTTDYDFSEHFGVNVHPHFVCKATDTFMFNGNFQFACLKYVPKLIKEENIDIVHFGHHMSGLLLELRGLNVPSITTVHTTIQGQLDGTRTSGMRVSELEFSEKAVYLAYPFLRLAEVMYFSKARYYITVSEWMKRELLRRHLKMKNPHVSVIHNSVDTRKFSPRLEGESVEDNLVLFTGRIIAGKGVRYLVEAMPYVLKEYPDAFFAFIGAGDFAPYRKRLKNLGVTEENFQFLGYLKRSSDLIKYYRACSVYAAPTTFSENLPIRVLEAMACGAPSVASNVCAIPEAINDGVNGILVSPGSVKELTDAICSLLGDSNLRKRIGERARETILRKFDCTANTLRTVEVYRRIVETSSSG
jgi:glycosyltransferase involved in cell wall biosynthesis